MVQPETVSQLVHNHFDHIHLIAAGIARCVPVDSTVCVNRDEYLVKRIVWGWV